MVARQQVRFLQSCACEGRAKKVSRRAATMRNADRPACGSAQAGRGVGSEGTERALHRWSAYAVDIRARVRRGPTGVGYGRDNGNERVDGKAHQQAPEEEAQEPIQAGSHAQRPLQTNDKRVERLPTDVPSSFLRTAIQRDRRN